MYVAIAWLMSNLYIVQQMSSFDFALLQIPCGTARACSKNPGLVAEWVLPVLGISLASSLTARVVVVSTAARQHAAPGLNLKLVCT